MFHVVDQDDLFEEAGAEMSRALAYASGGEGVMSEAGNAVHCGIAELF